MKKRLLTAAMAACVLFSFTACDIFGNLLNKKPDVTEPTESETTTEETTSVGVFDSIEKNKNGQSVRKTNEVDFRAIKGNRAYYIQIAENISDESTRAREIKPFKLLKDQVQKVLVINRPVKETRDENGFTIIGVTDFLLRFIK